MKPYPLLTLNHFTVPVILFAKNQFKFNQQFRYMKRKSGAPRVVRSLFQEKRGVYHLKKSQLLGY